jgi:hypothetical protein
MRGFFDDDGEFFSGRYPTLSDYIQKTFQELPLEEVNLEEVITQLELSLEGFGALWEKPNPELTQAREEFDLYIWNRLQHSSTEELKGCECHNRIFRGALGSEDNSIITLNYDLVTDYTLYHLCKRTDGRVIHDSVLARSNNILGRILTWGGEAPTVHYSDRDKGVYLKLHGSIDWVYCPTPTCGNHQLFFANVIAQPEAHYSPGSPCILCGAGLVSVIIPPAMGKSFEKFPKMGLIWNLAYRELKEAGCWVLIGMSFPEADYYIRWLFREVLNHRERPPSLIVVNPNKDDIERTIYVLRVKSDETYNTIKEYAGQVAETAPT